MEDVEWIYFRNGDVCMDLENKCIYKYIYYIGNPKGVMNSQRSSYLQVLTGTAGLCASDCILQLPPLFHG